MKINNLIKMAYRFKREFLKEKKNTNGLIFACIEKKSDEYVDLGK